MYLLYFFMYDSGIMNRRFQIIQMFSEKNPEKIFFHQILRFSELIIFSKRGEYPVWSLYICYNQDMPQYYNYSSIIRDVYQKICNRSYFINKIIFLFVGSVRQQIIPDFYENIEKILPKKIILVFMERYNSDRLWVWSVYHGSKRSCINPEKNNFFLRILGLFLETICKY